MTAPDRLDPLMKWINGDRMTDAQIRRSLLRFLKGFPGQRLKLQTDAGMWDAYYAAPDNLNATRDNLITLLNTAFPSLDGDRRGTENITFEDCAPPLAYPSLRFGVWPNSSDLLVDGDLPDLVPFLVLHLITSHQVQIARCEAPLLNDWALHCGRFYVWLGRGRPKMFCSNACKTRQHDKAEFERERARALADKKSRKRK
jgi:hypothetical protein